MSRLTRDGTAEPVSRDQILRHARGQGNIIFPVQLTTSRIGNLTRLIHTLLYVMTIWSSPMATVWIDRVRLPILLVVSLTGKMNISLSPFAPENLISRDGFGSPVPRQPAHLHSQAEYGAYLRDFSRVPRRCRNPPIAKKLFQYFFMTLVDGQHIRQSALYDRL